jgi:hypothetical protein
MLATAIGVQYCNFLILNPTPMALYTLKNYNVTM